MDALAAAMYGIRCQNRENPYGNQYQHSATINKFVNPDMLQEEISLETISGKVFGDGGSPKRFGRFK